MFVREIIADEDGDPSPKRLFAHEIDDRAALVAISRFDFDDHLTGVQTQVVGGLDERAHEAVQITGEPWRPPVMDGERQAFFLDHESRIAGGERREASLDAGESRRAPGIPVHVPFTVATFEPMLPRDWKPQRRE